MRQVVHGAKASPLFAQGGSMTVKAENSSTTVRLESCDDVQAPVEQDRRVRREIANSNERRRMQSINAGYQCLRSMLPHREGGEKLSKAAVLQQASEYMQTILDERKQLLLQNTELRRMVGTSKPECTLPSKRRKRDTESSDEGIGMSFQGLEVTASSQPELDIIDELRRDVTELRVQLERERQRNAYMERSYYSLIASSANMAAAAAAVTPPQQVRMMEPVYNTSPDVPLSPPASKQEVTAPCSGRASSVASRNLNIIVEAINHLEADKPSQTSVASSSEKETDSGMSLCESSDDTKSECSDHDAHTGSLTEHRQPPPAHTHSTSSAHAMYNTPPSLMYRPTFLSTLPTAQALSTAQASVIVSPQAHMHQL